MKRLGSLLACSLAIGGAAFATSASAATGHHKAHRHSARAADSSSTSSTTSSPSTGSTGPTGGSGETALTGTTLSSASAAALAAVPGGTVLSATTENDASTGAYEVIVQRSDGSRVKVIEDASFTVLSTAATTCG